MFLSWISRLEIKCMKVQIGVSRFLFIVYTFGENFTSFVSFCAPETMNWSLLKESSLDLLLVNPLINGSETSIVP